MISEHDCVLDDIIECKLHEYDEIIRICQEDIWGHHYTSKAEQTLMSIGAYCVKLREMKRHKDLLDLDNIKWPSKPDVVIET